MEPALQTYADELALHLNSGIAREQTYRPALAALMQTLRDGVVASNDPAHIEAGAPDYTVWIDSASGPLTIGYVEAKDIGISLDATEASEQLARYRQLPNLVLTDYLEFRWYRDGERQDITGRLGHRDGTNFVPDEEGAARVAELLRAFLGQDPLPIRRAEDLAKRMAILAHLVRDGIVRLFTLNKASTTLVDLRRTFSEVLIPDIEVEEFADMFAQTIAYGLFAARINHRADAGHFSRADAATEIPRTNPFLRRLFTMIAGPDLDDEPFVGFVDDLVRLLARADMPAVLTDFGRQAGRDDPVVHFYETFLQAYDPELRELRGVYYTPEAVVSYIVRSVDQILKDRFDCAAGLADVETTTYRAVDAEGAEREATSPRVLILDPACGTGTFLYTVIAGIRETFRQQGNAGLWRGYVRDHLLPRLFGFELLMAPYAVAHLKLGMQLAGLDLPEEEQADWAYDFASDDRLSVFLTNSLEPSVRAATIPFGAFISEEANAAADVKSDLPIMVVLGNPPYSGHSANASSRQLIDPNDARRRIRERTWIGELINSYFFVDDAPLAERNPKWLHDDYVKFLRFGQWRIDQTGAGVLAFITNHAYLMNRNFRGMRQQLMESFSDIYILDLHGNARSRHLPPGGGADSNVFDIQQGVAIALFVKDPERAEGPAQVWHADLWGTRATKYDWLDANDVTTTDWTEVEPRSRFYLFKPQNLELADEYERGWRLTEAMPTNVVGFQTHRDHFAVAIDRETMVARLDDLRDTGKTDAELRETHNLTDNRDWELEAARETIQGDADWEDHLIECLYRPFDTRWCYFSPVAMDYPRREMQRHVAGRNNMCLGVGPGGNAVDDPEWSLVFSSREPADANVFRRGGITVCPLYLYPGEAGEQVSLIEAADPGGPTPNLAEGFTAAFADQLGLEFLTSEAGDLETTFGPEDVFHYIYALLHSQSYRIRYADFLDIDYPRIPIPPDVDLFRDLLGFGSRLFALHQLEALSLADAIATYPIPGSDIVEIAPRFVPDEEVEVEAGAEAALDVPVLGRIYISENAGTRRAQYFDGVPEEVWAFRVGGYQVAEKWLKDRRRRAITPEIPRFMRVLTAIAQTIEVMGEIEEELEVWPWEIPADPAV
ncbi:MAG: N-6 DNA methylase [Gaiellaceae bacterium MAG52_C11]|nr:N-6 DNA methylase [Candidatus Gaiellasilicea maunaloa]